MVWHYATWASLPRIVESGALRGSNAGAPGEAPMLWFSANQQWEPTATKWRTDKTGKPFPMTFKEQVKTVGCIRFGLPADDPCLLNWKAACAAAGTPRETRRSLEKVGKKKGADPANWFATLRQVALSELHFQVWAGGWFDATSPQDMADVWTEEQAIYATKIIATQVQPVRAKSTDSP